MGENVIELSCVEKKLGSFALRDISFAMPKGYIMGLIGPNGAGKTTLLHLMMGLYRADAGSIRVFGCDPAVEEVSVRSKIGWVLSEELFYAGHSLRDNANLYGKYYPNYEPALFEEYCGRFGLKTERSLGRLSRGEKLKFQFAFALSHRAELLLLDEPTASFDPAFREEFFRIITDFISDGEHSVILATHLTKDLDRLADYVTMLNDGKLAFSLERGELEERYRIVSGELYKLKLLPAERVIAVETGAYGAKAFVKHNARNAYDPELCVSVPTLEEIMYYTMAAQTRKARPYGDAGAGARNGTGKNDLKI